MKYPSEWDIKNYGIYTDVNQPTFKTFGVLGKRGDGDYIGIQFEIFEGKSDINKTTSRFQKIRINELEAMVPENLELGNTIIIFEKNDTYVMIIGNNIDKDLFKSVFNTFKFTK